MKPTDAEIKAAVEFLCKRGYRVSKPNRCEHCGEELHERMWHYCRYCWMCGKKLSDEAYARQMENGETKTCEECGGD